MPDTLLCFDWKTQSTGNSGCINFFQAPWRAEPWEGTELSSIVMNIPEVTSLDSTGAEGTTTTDKGSPRGRVHECTSSCRLLKEHLMMLYLPVLTVCLFYIHLSALVTATCPFILHSYIVNFGNMLQKSHLNKMYEKYTPPLLTNH